MVTADNLHLDVLESIFNFLSGGDLTSVALVSRSFFSAVIPTLYSTLKFRRRQAKRYRDIITPFAVILSRPELAPHVKHIDIRAVPMVRTGIDTKFLIDCRKAIELCKNVVSLRCTQEAVLPALLSSLAHKDRLQALRARAKLTTDQAALLLGTGSLRSIAIDLGSLDIMKGLPAWINFQNSDTLTTLVLFMCQELNEEVLSQVHMPNLTSFHVVGCPRVDHLAVLRLTENLPLLESLSMMVSENPQSLSLPPPVLPNLRHLTFDIHFKSPTPSAQILIAILSHLKFSGPALRSFSLRLTDRHISLPHAFIDQLLQLHALTLQKLSLNECVAAIESIKAICKQCINLTLLEAPLPLKDLGPFIQAVGRSKSLETLVDTETHTHIQSLTRENVLFMMNGCPKLRTIASENRVWQGQYDAKHEKLQLGFETAGGPHDRSYWFLEDGWAYGDD